MLNAIAAQTSIVFSAGKRLAECLGTFEGIRDQVMVLPPETAGAGAHALNRNQLSLLECLVVQACALFQKPREATDASLHSLASLLGHTAARTAAVAKRDAWYPHLDAREGLIDSAKKDVEARIDRFRTDLKAYKVGGQIRTIRNKAIAHVTTFTLIEPLIHDVTCVAMRSDLCNTRMTSSTGETAVCRVETYSGNPLTLLWPARSPLAQLERMCPVDR